MVSPQGQLFSKHTWTYRELDNMSYAIKCDASEFSYHPYVSHVEDVLYKSVLSIQ